MYWGPLSNLDPDLIIYTLLFVIFFVFIQLILSRSLRDKNSASIIAFCVSLLSIYGLSKTGFDISQTVYNIGINQEIIYNVLPIIALIGILFVIIKVKMRYIMTFLGIGLIVGSFFVYRKYLILGVGIGCLIIGLFLIWKEARRAVKHRVYLK